MDDSMLSLLCWGDKLEILSYLNLHELYRFGCTSKTNFVIFLREKTYNEYLQEQKALNSHSSRSLGRFLAAGWKRKNVALVSYPRSGNSYLRRLLETWSTVITGSDSRPNRTLSASLLRSGFRVFYSCPNNIQCFIILITSTVLCLHT